MRCWRCSAAGERRRGQRERGWSSPPRRSCSGQGDFSPCREGPRPFRSNHPSTPTETLRRFPHATHHLRAMHAHAPDPDQTRYPPFTNHFACALRCAHGQLLVGLRVGILLPRRRACGAYGQVTLWWPSLELHACNLHAKKIGVLSAATRVRWACVRACAMCRASRGRSDACMSMV